MKSTREDLKEIISHLRIGYNEIRKANEVLADYDLTDFPELKTAWLMCSTLSVSELLMQASFSLNNYGVRMKHCQSRAEESTVSGTHEQGSFSALLPAVLAPLVYPR